MHPLDCMNPELDNFIALALREDVRDGDHSSLACISESQIGKARLLVKDEGILAGVQLAEYIFQKVDAEIKFNLIIKDGTPVKKGDIVFEVEGKVRTILMLERLVLNCIQRMSGIATRTHRMVSLLEGANTQLLDTRKTTPGIRFLEKWAVKIGGGVNHRFGLYDMIMLKDNHIDAAGGITKAIQSTREYLKSKNLNLKIEVETRNLNEVKEAIACGGIDRIMLDNFSPEKMQEAVAIINKRFETEASGGITENNMREYAQTGVDFISSSAMTHSVKSLDLSLKIY
ncbi:MAG: carboxylating nicotinate-nucleotide diphosphorylase [Bacteroidetes bacterium]|nr:carboxylating nicotinate-nucleotide diphosphorylase [Bacteroidota bacterium]